MAEQSFTLPATPTTVDTSGQDIQIRWDVSILIDSSLVQPLDSGVIVAVYLRRVHLRSRSDSDSDPVVPGDQRVILRTAPTPAFNPGDPGPDLTDTFEENWVITLGGHEFLHDSFSQDAAEPYVWRGNSNGFATSADIENFRTIITDLASLGTTVTLTLSDDQEEVIPGKSLGTLSLSSGIPSLSSPSVTKQSPSTKPLGDLSLSSGDPTLSSPSVAKQMAVTKPLGDLSLSSGGGTLSSPSVTKQIIPNKPIAQVAGPTVGPGSPYTAGPGGNLIAGPVREQRIGLTSGAPTLSSASLVKQALMLIKPLGDLALSSGAPSLTSPSVVKQSPDRKDLGDLALSSGAPTLSSPSVTKQAIAAKPLGTLSLSSGTPTLSTASVIKSETVHKPLGDLALSSGAPSLTSPSVVKQSPDRKDLGDLALSSGAPTLSSPSVTKQAIAAKPLGTLSLSSGTPTLSSPSVGKTTTATKTLGTLSLSSGLPTLSSPSVTKQAVPNKDLGDLALSSGASSLSNPAVNKRLPGRKQLGTLTLSSGAPTLSSPSVGKTTAANKTLGSLRLSSGAAALSSPSVAKQVPARKALGTLALSSGAPTLSSPSLNKRDPLSATTPGMDAEGMADTVVETIEALFIGDEDPVPRSPRSPRPSKDKGVRTHTEGDQVSIEASIPGMPDFEAGGGRGRIRDLAEVFVAELQGATVRVDLVSTGTSTNLPGPPPTPGAYTGSGSVSSGGEIEGFSASSMATKLKDRWDINEPDEDRIEPEETRDTVNSIIDLLCDEVAEEVGHARCTASTSDTGLAPAGGGKVSGGTGTGFGTLDSMDADRFKESLEEAITDQIGEDRVDFDIAMSGAILGALTSAFVHYVHTHAQVTITTTLDVDCLPSGGAASGTGEETAGDLS